MNPTICISHNVICGKNVSIANFVNLYGCTIGHHTKIGAFVEIQKNAVIGNFCKISSHSFICEGVTIEDNCFIGHGVMFINDNHPQAVNKEGHLENEKDWKGRFVTTHIGKKVIIGTNATILGNITIGDGAVIGAGSVVTKNVPPHEVWIGNPAKKMLKAQVF
jgi:acetyltransferase-like isoleucine patch superfamily enzyme